MRKLLSTIMLAAGMILVTAGVAQAHHVVDFDATCTTASVSFAQFHELDTDIVITVDGAEYPQDPIEGDATYTVDIGDAAQDGSVTVGAHWNHDGEAVDGGSETFELPDCVPTPTPTPTHSHYPPSPSGCHADSSCHTRQPHATSTNGTAFTGPTTNIAMAGVIGVVLAIVGGAALLRYRSRTEG